MAEPPGRRDGLIALGFALGGLLLYGALALRLAEGRLYEYWNLAFDWDAARVLSMLTETPPDGMGFKHPLMIALRPLGLGFMAVGLAPKQAAGMSMALAGALGLGTVFLLLRACRIARPEAAALALVFGLSGTQLATAIVPESYGFAMLSIALVWLLAARRLEAPGRLRAARYAAAVFAAGVTVSNAMHAVIAEAWQEWRRRAGLRAWLGRMLRYGLILGLVFAAAAMLLWGRTILAALADPLDAARDIWWLQTQGERTGPGAVLEVFLVLAFVLPEFSVVPLPEGTRMLDVREWAYGPLGWAAALLWMALLAAGTAAGLANRHFRAIALPVLVVLTANLLFHSFYQFRGSLFIYAGHTQVPALLLAAGLAPWAQARAKLRRWHLGAVLLLGLLTALVNLPLMADFATRFDTPATTCPPPCA